MKQLLNIYTNALKKKGAILNQRGFHELKRGFVHEAKLKNNFVHSTKFEKGRFLKQNVLVRHVPFFSVARLGDQAMVMKYIMKIVEEENLDSIKSIEKFFNQLV